MKRKRLLMVVGIVCVILTLVALLLPACAPKEEVPVAPAAPIVPAEEEEEEVVPTVPTAPEVEVITWRYQSMQYAGTVGWEWSLEFAEDIERATGGRLDIEYVPCDTVVGAFEAADAIAGGLLDAGENFGCYVQGYVPCAMVYYDGTAVLFDEWDLLVYMYYYMEPRSWMDVYREAMVEQNIYVLNEGPVCSYGELMSTKPVRSVADFEGLKVRCFGHTANVIEALGSSLVTVPSGEMYTALALGTIDAAAWATAVEFIDYKLYEVASYYIQPAVAQWVSMGTWINLDSWNALPDDIKEILEAVGMKHMMRTPSNMLAESYEAKRTLAEDFGIEFCTLPQADMDAMAPVAISLLNTYEKEANDPYTTELLQMMFDFMRLVWKGHLLGE